jgi:ABC-type bacteriocin/lantibiotic exporter with double-glycine peptidase domain
VLPFHETDFLAVALAAMVFAHAAAAYRRAILLVYLQARMDDQMMLSFLDHLLSLPFGFFQQRSSGDLLCVWEATGTIREARLSQWCSTGPW